MFASRFLGFVGEIWMEVGSCDFSVFLYLFPMMPVMELISNREFVRIASIIVVDSNDLFLDSVAFQVEKLEVKNSHFPLVFSVEERDWGENHFFDYFVRRCFWLDLLCGSALMVSTSMAEGLALTFAAAISSLHCFLGGAKTSGFRSLSRYHI